jgi:hypothetical protein
MQNKKRGQRGRAKATLDLIASSLKIIEERQPITVRGVAYALFVAGKISSMAEVNKVSRILKNAREDGSIPWAGIVDDSRSLEYWSQFADLGEFGDFINGMYSRDFWSDQLHYPIVISEKSTVSGILHPVLSRYGVPFLVAHGFNSATVMHNLAMRIRKDWRRIVFLYVGDNDPSGMCMSEVDMPARLARYGATDYDLKRIAITEADGASLPSFSADTKKGDTRYKWFVANHGRRCWELDAMNPNDLRVRVELAITELVNAEAWERHQRIEAAQRETVKTVARRMAAA